MGRQLTPAEEQLAQAMARIARRAKMRVKVGGKRGSKSAQSLRVKPSNEASEQPNHESTNSSTPTR